MDEAPAGYVALLRDHLSSEPVSSHGAAVAVRRVAERAKASGAAGADAERFVALHGSLREREVRELDRFTLLLQRLGEERALAELLRATSAPAASPANSEAEGRGAAALERSTASSVAASASGSVAPSPHRRGVAPTDASWLFARRPLCGRHLEPAASGEAREAPPPLSALGSLPLDVQEASLVDDLLLVLCGFDGSRIRAQPAARAGSAAPPLSPTGAPAMRFVTSDDGQEGAGGPDPSLLGLARRLLPTADRCVYIYMYMYVCMYVYLPIYLPSRQALQTGRGGVLLQKV